MITQAHYETIALRACQCKLMQLNNERTFCRAGFSRRPPVSTSTNRGRVFCSALPLAASSASWLWT
jgi:hypothetical protein